MTTPQWPTVEPDDPHPAPGAAQQPHHPPPYQQQPYWQPPFQPQQHHQPPLYHYDGYPTYPPYPPPAPPRPQPPPHRWGFGAFLLAEAVFLITSLIVPLVALIPYTLRDPNAVPDGAPLPGPVLLAVLSVPPVVAAAVALYATKVRGNGPVIDLRLKFGWRDVGIGMACGFAGLFLVVPLGWLWVNVVGEERASSAVGEVFDGMHMPVVLAVLVFLDVWLLAPICEEILYRGLLWGAMERREWNRWIILGVTTVVFAVAHLEPIRTPLLLVIGLPIGVARMLSGRLVAPVIAHQINNFLPAMGLLMLLLGVPVAS